MAAQHQFKILSIDGGGIRGIISRTFLKFIENQVGSLSNKFDFIVVTYSIRLKNIKC